MFWYIYKFTKYLHGTWSLLNILMIFAIKEKIFWPFNVLLATLCCLRLVLWSRVTYENRDICFLFNSLILFSCDTGISYIAPHLNNLYFLTLCQRLGVYQVVRGLFLLKFGLSVVMLLAGADHVYLLCIFIARWEMNVPRALLLSDYRCSASYLIWNSKCYECFSY